ncbi:MAG: 16S rRNA processing protein RimM [Deltaproteobacteria bacterium]|nr:16S rRNA processing protein RimM [Deltaproteobacteria bacterium]MBW1961230.1 16S rRNA processing protein RimM [Deltaproteobacteria bacterium]MBW2151691.1 16S rRNA processing protein RimM [Deltaproteobacteria bacterium]
MEREGFLLIGKIIGAHGVRGAIKIHSYAQSLSVFEPGSRIYLRGKQDWEKTYTIRWAKPHGKAVLLALAEIDNRDSAEALRGVSLFIDRKSLPEPEQGEYYWVDIIGLYVYTTKGACIGRVTSIMPTGSNDVYVVEDKGKERLIPALESVVLNIDLKNKRMTVELPEGL